MTAGIIVYALRISALRKQEVVLRGRFLIGVQLTSIKISVLEIYKIIKPNIKFNEII